MRKRQRYIPNRYIRNAAILIYGTIQRSLQRSIQVHDDFYDSRTWILNCPGRMQKRRSWIGLPRSETDAVSHTLSLPVGVNRVGSEDGVRCHFSFLVTLACENDSFHFPLFSLLLRYNACVFNCSKF